MKSDKTPILLSPYARISDTDEERAPGIDRQLRIVHPLLAGNGYTSTRDYIDNNKSAFDPDVYRDDFEQWLVDFEAGRTDGVVAYHIDRVTRQLVQLERIISIYVTRYKRTGLKGIFLFPSGNIDLTNSDGQLYARMLVMMANKSSSDTVRRISDFYRDEALKGKIFSPYPAFYRNPDGSINEDRAVIAHKAVADVLAGIRPTAIAEEWRSLGITSTRGKRPTHSTVRRILTAPGIAGLAVYKEEILIGSDGEPIMREDGGLVTVDTWRAVCEVLKPRMRRKRPTKGLLSRTLRCGRCGSYMVHMHKSDTFFTYNCRSQDSGGCGITSISGPRLDAQITDLVLAYLDQPIEPPKEQPNPAAGRLKEVGSKIAELMAAYNAGDLSGSIVFPQIKKLEDEQQELRSKAAKQVKTTRTATTAAEEWPALSLDRQKAIVEELFEAIVIAPAKNVRAKGVQTKYDPDRVTIVPRSTDK